jgi:hypothetical protein
MLAFLELESFLAQFPFVRFVPGFRTKDNHQKNVRQEKENKEDSKALRNAQVRTSAAQSRNHGRMIACNSKTEADTDL